MSEKHYDDSIRMDDIEQKIKEECGDCKAWSGTDCTRNPYTQGCLKDSSENSVTLVEDISIPEGVLTTKKDNEEPIIIKMGNNKIENYEMVDHPKHYNPGVYEAINVIEAYDLNFSLGNAIKYILRTAKGKPDASLDEKFKAAEDLRKAAWYCNREANRIIQEKTVKNS